MQKVEDDLVRHRQISNIVFHVFSPILFGMTVYALFRNIPFIDPTRKVFPLLDLSFPFPWVIFNLPDGLWFYALLSSLIIIWGGNSSRQLVAWIVFAISISFILELCQGFNLIPGTFDVKDLIANCIASILCFFLFNRQLQHQ